MKNILALMLAGLVVVSPSAFGISQAESGALKDEADKEATLAIRFEKQALQALQSGQLDREKLREILKLLIDAGKLFEQAGNTYQASGINYESSQNANNAFAATQRCLDLIKQVRARIENTP